MHLSLRRVGAALTLSTALAASGAALAAPAHAAKWTHQDSVGDVVAVESMGPGGTAPEAAPERTDIDVTKVVARHEGRKLTIKVRTRSAMTGPLSINGEIRTPRKRLLLMSMRLPGFMNSTELWDLKSAKDDPTVRCRGLSRSIDKSRRVMTFTVPRSCIGNPKWVRFSLQMSAFDVLTDDDRMYVDDALRQGISGYGAGKVSPKIKHG